MLSDEKITHLSHVLLKGLMEKKLITPKEEEGKLRRAMKNVIASELKKGERMDTTVRQKLQSYARKIIEGSPEWEILYKKFFREEEIKKGRG